MKMEILTVQNHMMQSTKVKGEFKWLDRVLTTRSTIFHHQVCYLDNQKVKFGLIDL